jgi:hypothetical protein
MFQRQRNSIAKWVLTERPSLNLGIFSSVGSRESKWFRRTERRVFEVAIVAEAGADSASSSPAAGTIAAYL